MNKIKLLVITLILLTKSHFSFGQQDPMYTQYMFNTLAVNPGYAGSSGALNLMGIVRDQWVGIEGAPKTQSFIMQSPIIRENIGMGLSVVNDQIGPTNQTMIFGDYSYTIRTSKSTKLAFGLKAGVNIIKSGLTSLNIIEQNDQSFASDINYKPLPNFGFGLYYHADRWFVGLSVPKILQNKIESSVEYSKQSEQRHYFLIAGYVFDLNNHVKFKPSTLIKATIGAPLSIDMNASFLFRDKLWLGAGYRYGDAFNAMLQLQISDQFKAGYSFDYSVSNLSSYNSGSHEIILSYTFNFKKDKILSPRYF